MIQLKFEDDVEVHLDENVVSIGVGTQPIYFAKTAKVLTEEHGFNESEISEVFECVKRIAIVKYLKGCIV